jgi:hypothetical protein
MLLPVCCIQCSRAATITVVDAVLHDTCGIKVYTFPLITSVKAAAVFLQLRDIEVQAAPPPESVASLC